jgi:phosphoglycolate phosphatase
VASFRHVLAVVEIAAKDEQIHHLIGPPLVDGFAALGVPADQLDHAVETYRVYFSHTGLYQNRLYGGIKNMLGTLKQAGIILAVATSKRVEFAHRILDHFGISAFFEVAAGASVDGSLLQEADIVADALVRLDQPDPSSVVMAGDRGQDMNAAIAHQLRPVGATWGYGTEAELIEPGATHLVAHPDALVECELATL